ncbi:MAG: sigma 54-interacting transcriptional regulator [Candidatus Methylomirabilis sp.]|nr:sigma 54-interacting transcriptional regulator [Candidatus Methylomirabilis sp.]
MTRKRTVRVEPLGITLEADASEPILQVALRQGLRLVDYRCADGECGGCKARVRSGQVTVLDPPAHVLSASEQAQGHVLLCRTHVQSDLVIELLAGALLAAPVYAARPVPPAEALLGPLVATADLLSDGLLVLDAQGQLVLCNRAAAQLLRLDPAAPAGTAIPELVALGRSLLATPRPPAGGQAVHPGPAAQRLGAHPAGPAAPGRRPRPPQPPGAAPRAQAEGGGGGGQVLFADLVGQSAAFRNATKIGLIAAGNTLSVLIAGESGTGKEMLAHAIHASSPRAPKPFIAVNCGAIPGS